jgi:hypothetical protein
MVVRTRSGFTWWSRGKQSHRERKVVSTVEGQDCRTSRLLGIRWMWCLGYWKETADIWISWVPIPRLHTGDASSSMSCFQSHHFKGYKVYFMPYVTLPPLDYDRKLLNLSLKSAPALTWSWRNTLWNVTDKALNTLTYKGVLRADIWDNQVADGHNLTEISNRRITDGQQAYGEMANHEAQRKQSFFTSWLAEIIGTQRCWWHRETDIHTPWAKHWRQSESTCRNLLYFMFCSLSPFPLVLEMESRADACQVSPLHGAMSLAHLSEFKCVCLWVSISISRNTSHGFTHLFIHCFIVCISGTWKQTKVSPLGNGTVHAIKYMKIRE